MNSDVEINQAAQLKSIDEIVKSLDIKIDDLFFYGPYQAKLKPSFTNTLKEHKTSKLILVTAMSPTPAGEGKTTTTIGLADALFSIGKKSAACLREPSLGPVFGMKGGATGGGYAQVAPMDKINLHFTGDFHAITSANNLLAALIDNHIHHGNELNIDINQISFKRCLDMNDRALRHVELKLGQNHRDTGFDITVASEVMAIFCLAESLEDLQNRLGEIEVAKRVDSTSVYAKDLKAQGAMTALLKDAFQPNLVQTLHGTPAFIHGGPFANIAHGCNSVIATKTALKLADYVVTEAGFGADLGAEKFIDIKCRAAGIHPSVAVIVATVRALKFHGGADPKNLSEENLEALAAGFANLDKHLDNIQNTYGLPVVVSINHFTADTDAEIALLKKHVEGKGVPIVVATHWANGGAGATELAEVVAGICEQDPRPATQPHESFVYADKLTLLQKIEAIATAVYGASEVTADSKVRTQLNEFQERYPEFPVCIAKTQYSFSTDPALKGAPTGHSLNIREVRLSAGAGFIVAVCGDVMTMPGLPKVPSSERIDLVNGAIVGLF